MFRSEGGDNTAENLALLCDGHHKALHDGKLRITGTAPDHLQFVWTRDRSIAPEPQAHVGPSDVQTVEELKSKFEMALLRNDVKQALVNLGFKQPQAGAAADQALEHVGAHVDLAALIREALKHCPKGRG